MKSRKLDRDERGADAVGARAAARRAKDVRGKLARGELVIEFEFEHPAETAH
ncbi:hypothetical protein [Sphingomonas sp. dw_22]|uniref:hypothetical protein n=1 Tax=Sphingomonas sp. dw_22 TaxID=2721175 RepID=UPI001BD3D5B0|nr:hypothetical protein [Sphingomonas sp. dw_22]